MRRLVSCLIMVCILMSLLCILMPVETYAADTPVNLITNGTGDDTSGWWVGDNWSICGTYGSNT